MATEDPEHALAMLHEITDASQDALIGKSLEGIITYWNRRGGGGGRAMEEHGGGIALETGAGRGTRVVVVLPS